MPPLTASQRSILTDLVAINYINPAFPLSFTSASALREYYAPWLSPRQIMASLQRVPAYAMKTVKRKRRTHYNPTLVWSAGKHFQGDLIDLSMLAAANRGVHFLLVILDGFTRAAAVMPLRTKRAEETATAFDDWIQNGLLPSLGLPPARQTRSGGSEGHLARAREMLGGAIFHCDRGLEFVGAPFKRVLEKYG